MAQATVVPRTNSHGALPSGPEHRPALDAPFETKGDRSKASADAYASEAKRVGAYLVDLASWQPFALGTLVAYLAKKSNPAARGARAVAVACFSTGMAVSFYNKCVRMGRTGQSWAKKAVNTSLVFDRNRRPIGVGMAVVREFCHVVDIVSLGMGYLLPLWDHKRQTIADKMMGTVVVQGRVPPLDDCGRASHPAP